MVIHRRGHAATLMFPRGPEEAIARRRPRRMDARDGRADHPWGIPTKHDLIFLWLGLGMAAFSLEASRVVRDWLPLVGIIFVYDLLRGVADGLVFLARETPQIRVENALFGKPTPTTWLQEHFWHGAERPALVGLRGVVSPPHALLRDVHRRGGHLGVASEQFSRYAAMMCVLALTGFVTYVLFPAAPPWMAAQHGDLGESNRMIGPIWHHIPLTHAGAVFEHGQGIRERRRRDAVAARGIRALFTLYLWRLGAALGPARARAVPARDVSRPRLLG